MGGLEEETRVKGQGRRHSGTNLGFPCELAAPDRRSIFPPLSSPHVQGRWSVPSCPPIPIPLPSPLTTSRNPRYDLPCAPQNTGLLCLLPPPSPPLPPDPGLPPICPPLRSGLLNESRYCSSSLSPVSSPPAPPSCPLRAGPPPDCADSCLLILGVAPVSVLWN